MKKNKITILLIAAVLMLTIYYLSIPSNPGIDNQVNNPITNNNEPVVQESYYLVDREEILSTRTEMYDKLNLVLGSDVSSLNEKELALATMLDLTTLTEKELTLEKMIKNLGYEDCLVYVNDKSIKINILSDEFSVDEFIEVAVMSKNYFDSSFTVNIEIDKKN